jgi:hypothetical protein
VPEDDLGDVGRHAVEDGVGGEDPPFLARDLALPFVDAGADLLIMEGPKVVAHAEIREVLDEHPVPDAS